MSVQVSQVHGGAVGSSRTSLVNGELEVEECGFSVALVFLRVWAEGPGTARRRDSSFGEGVGRLGPAPAVLVV